MNRTTIQAVLGLSATLVCALGFAALAHAGGGDNDNPYNMPRSFGGGGNTGGGGNGGGNTGDETQSLTAGVQRGPIEATPGADKSQQTQAGKTTLIPYTVEAGAQFKFVTAMNATNASVEAKGAQIKTLMQSPYVAMSPAMPSIKALAGSSVAAKNVSGSAKLQGVFELQPGAAKVMLQLPANRTAAVAAISLGTLGSNGSFAVEQMISVPVTTAGLDVSALAAQWASMPNTAGKTIKIQLGAGEPISLATITFPAGTAKPTFRVDTTPAAAP